MATQAVVSSHFECQAERQTRMPRILKLLKPSTNDVLPPTRPCLLNLHKQCYQLGIGIRMSEPVGTALIQTAILVGASLPLPIV